MTADQHARLEAFLIRITRPPRTFGYNDYFGLLLQAAGHEEELKAIFTLDQWTTVSVQLAEAKRLERNLREEGYVPDDASVAGPPAGRDHEPDASPERKRG